jgi:hypothetical protein
MFKKISILSLLLLFFVSTTGLPLTIHFCNMLNKEVSATCDMHMSSQQIGMMHEPCQDQNTNDNIVSLKTMDCCKTETIIAGVKDSFITNKTETQKILISDLMPVSSISVIDLSLKISTYSFIDTSPPPLTSNHIYIDNSILLI